MCPCCMAASSPQTWSTTSRTSRSSPERTGSPSCACIAISPVLTATYREGEPDLVDAIEITGGKPLHGEVTVSGSKNATLPQIAAALLAPGASVFHNVPDLADVRTMGRLIAHLGAKVSRGAEVGAHTLRVDA